MNTPLLGTFMTDSLLAILPWYKTRPCMSRSKTFAPMGAPDIWMWSAKGTASKWKGAWTATMLVCFWLELDFTLELDFALLELDFPLLDVIPAEEPASPFLLLLDTLVELELDFGVALELDSVDELVELSLLLRMTSPAELLLDSTLELDSVLLEEDSSVSELDDDSAALLEEMSGFSMSLCAARNLATYSLTMSALKVG